MRAMLWVRLEYLYKAIGRLIDLYKDMGPDFDKARAARDEERAQQAKADLKDAAEHIRDAEYTVENANGRTE